MRRTGVSRSLRWILALIICVMGLACFGTTWAAPLSSTFAPDVIASLQEQTPSPEASPTPTATPLPTLTPVPTQRDELRPNAIHVRSESTHVFGALYTVSTDGGLGTGAIAYTLLPGGTGVAEISGDTVHIGKPGTLLLQATQAADERFQEATSAVFCLTVDKAVPPPIYITGASEHTYGTPYALSCSGGPSRGQITYAVVGGTGKGTIQGDSLLVEQTGTILLQAHMDEDEFYHAAVSDPFVLTVHKARRSAPQIVSAPVHTYGIPYVIEVVGDTGIPVSFAVLPGGSGHAVVLGNTLDVLAAGTILLQATSAEDANYLAADSATFVLTVHKAPQPTHPEPNGLVITSPTLHTYGMPYAISSAGGYGPVTYTIVGGTGTATLSGAALNVSACGTIELMATAQGDENHLWGQSPVHTITVQKREQSIPLVIANAGSFVYGENMNVFATGGEGAGQVTFELLSGAGTIQDQQLRPETIGIYVVRARKAGDENLEEQRSEPQRIQVKGYAPRDLTLQVTQTDDLQDMRYRYVFEASADTAPGDRADFQFEVDKLVPGKGSIRDLEEDEHQGSARLALGDYTVRVIASSEDTYESATQQQSVSVNGVLSETRTDPFPENLAQVVAKAPQGMAILSYEVMVQTAVGHESPGDLYHSDTKTSTDGDRWTFSADGQQIETGYAPHGFTKTGTFPVSAHINEVTFTYEIVAHAPFKSCLSGQTSYTIHFNLEPRDE